MSYTPTNWQTGDIITAEKLNKMEQGISSVSILNVTFTYDVSQSDWFADKTYAEVASAINAGSLVLINAIFDDSYGAPGSEFYDGYGETGPMVARITNGYIYCHGQVYLYVQEYEKTKMQVCGFEWSAADGINITGYEFYFSDSPYSF